MGSMVPLHSGSSFLDASSETAPPGRCKPKRGKILSVICILLRIAQSMTLVNDTLDYTENNV